MKNSPDIKVHNQGTIWLFTPLTQTATDWVEENLDLEPWQNMGNSFAVDHRPAANLAEGMRQAGLVVE